MKRVQKYKPSRALAAYRTTIAARAAAVALILSPVIILAALWLGYKTPPQPAKPQQLASSAQFSPNATPQELSKVLKDVQSATDLRFIERDQVVQVLTRLKKDYKDGTINSKAQLDQALIDYLSSLKDRYAAVMTTQQYTDLMVSLSGQEIGIELNFSQDSATGNWVVQQMAADGPAAKAGLLVGDVLVSVESYHVEELKKIGNVGELVQFLFSQAGVIGSKAKVTVRRGADTYDFEIERVVIKTHPAITVTDPSSGGHMSHSDMDDGGESFVPDSSERSIQIIKVNFMEADNFLRDFETAITKAANDGVQGIILDLGGSMGGNGDAAIQVACMFIEKGVVAHSIDNVGPDAVQMRTYFVKDGKAYRQTKGPFKKDASGAITGQKDAKTTTEELPWKCNVYKGAVVVGVTGETQGSAELIAGALKLNRHFPVVGTDITAGKGMNQTYLPVSPDHVVRFSTSVYLFPDGNSIERRGVMPTIGAEQPQQYGSLLMQALDMQLRIVPFPEGPVKPETKNETKKDNNQASWMKFFRFGN